MGIVLAKVTIDWQASTESVGGDLPELRPQKLSFGTQTKKLSVPIPRGGKPFWIPMGEEGPSIKFQCKIIGTSDYDAWIPILAGDLLYCSSSNIAEVPSGTYWWVDHWTTDRKGGYLDHWDCEFVLERSYRKVNGDLR